MPPAVPPRLEPRTQIETGTHGLESGQTVEVVDLDGGGLRARVATRGAALLALWVPGPDGTLADVALGYGTLVGLASGADCLGTAIGRTAGRVAGASVTVDGRTFALDANLGRHTIHGGPTGLHAHNWTLAQVADASATFETVSPDGAGGFPGCLRVRLRYALADSALRLVWTATTDAPTPLALTHHVYVNLDGHDAGSVLGHRVRSPAEHYVELGPGAIPTGRLAPVAGTPLDLREPVAVGEIERALHPQIAVAGGLDHDLLIRPANQRHGDLRHAVRVWAEHSGRTLDVWTTEPGVHLYAGASIDVEGKGRRYGTHSGLAIETQPPPDATGRPGFPDVVLRPGRMFRSQTVYGFSADRVASRSTE